MKIIPVYSSNCSTQSQKKSLSPAQVYANSGLKSDTFVKNDVNFTGVNHFFSTLVVKNKLNRSRISTKADVLKLLDAIDNKMGLFITTKSGFHPVPGTEMERYLSQIEDGCVLNNAGGLVGDSTKLRDKIASGITPGLLHDFLLKGAKNVVVITDKEAHVLNLPKNKRTIKMIFNRFEELGEPKKTEYLMFKISKDPNTFAYNATQELLAGFHDCKISKINLGGDAF